MRFTLAVLAALLPATALAQQLSSPKVQTRPANDDSERAASTAFVQHLLSGKLSASDLPAALDGIAVTSVRAASAYTGAPAADTLLRAQSQTRHTFFNAAGYQQSYTSDAGGRTLIAHSILDGQHAGYGDYLGWFATIGVTAHPNAASATSWTGRNSGTVIGGQTGANTADANLYNQEYSLNDNGWPSVAAQAYVSTFVRTATSTRPYTTPWLGVRMQSLGTVSADAAYQVVGGWKVGLDLAGAALDANQNAIALKANQRIYFNAGATGAPTSWFSGDTGAAPGLSYANYNSATSTTDFVVGNSPTLRLSATSVTTPNSFSATQGYTIGGTTVIDGSRDYLQSVASIGAAGTTQETATALSAAISAVIGGSSGVRLQGKVGLRQEVFNRTGAALNVYPPTGAQIEALAVNSPYSVPNGEHRSFTFVSATQAYQSP